MAAFFVGQIIFQPDPDRVEVAEITGQMRSSAEENLERVPELEDMSREASELASRIRQ